MNVTEIPLPTTVIPVLKEIKNILCKKTTLNKVYRVALLLLFLDAAALEVIMQLATFCCRPRAECGGESMHLSFQVIKKCLQAGNSA